MHLGKINIQTFSIISIFIVFLLGLILRLVLSPLAFHDDLIVNAGWGEWIYKNGSRGFYENNTWTYSWPTQPPLISIIYGFNYFIYEQTRDLFVNLSLFIAIHRLGAGHLLWWFDFVKWFGTNLYFPTHFLTGFLISMKFLAILSDLIIAGIVYVLAKKLGKMAILFAVIYLFSPFSFYISSLWGQYDQLSFLFLLISFLLLEKKLLILAPVFLLISLNIKPTSLIFIPIFLWVYFRQRPSPKIIFLVLVLGVIISLISLLAFAGNNIVDFVRFDLVPRIVFKAEFRVSTNAFNFWHILIGNQALNQNIPFIFVPAKVWGFLAFIFLNILAIRQFKNINLQSIFKAMFIVGMGSWLFMTNMLDRYVFAGVVCLLLLSIMNIKLLKYFFAASLIFWLNLYNGWWFPVQFDILRMILNWQDGFITRALSLVNTGLFIIIVYSDLRKMFVEIKSLNLLKRFKLVLLKYESSRDR